MARDVKYLLVGGGMASFHAARQIRAGNKEGSILLVSEEPLPPYDRPPLSKEYLRGEKTTADLVYEDADKLAANGIDLALGVRAESLNTEAHTLTLEGGETVRFEKALLATGGRPIHLPVPGADLEGVYYLRTAADAEAIGREAVAGRRAVVIGGGFIGIEVAASLAQRGVSVTVVEALPHIWARFTDETVAEYFQRYCGARSISFVTNARVTELLGEGRVSAVVTQDDVLACDFVCIGVGIVPNVDLAVDAGLAVDNGIVVDAQMRTSHPDVYAAGDVASYPDNVFEKRRRVEHWGHAEYTGQIAGRNMAGGSDEYNFLSYVWSDVFDLRLEFAGDESERDRSLIRGQLEDDSFAVLYMRGGRLTAYFAVNTPVREFSVLRRLIRARTDLSGHDKDLADSTFALRALLQA